ncbi:MAG: nitrate/nitrite transporter NrtS [Actinomycetota bacterium]
MLSPPAAFVDPSGVGRGAVRNQFRNLAASALAAAGFADVSDLPGTLRGLVSQGRLTYHSPRGEGAGVTGRQMAWATPGEAFGLVFLRATLRRTVRIALVVGTILSLVNQGAVILDGHASTVTWLRVAANYFVPFCVSSAGFLSATRVAREPAPLVEPETVTTSPVGGAP